MDGVTQANYAQSYGANVNVNVRPQPQRVQQQPARQTARDIAAPQRDVTPANAQRTGGVRPEDAGARVTRSVDGDTITISAEGQAYVQQAAAAAETPDVTSATARVESSYGDTAVQAARNERPEPAEYERPEPARYEPPADTRFDRPQGGGIERPEFERPQVQQIQDEAEETQAAERAEPRPRAERTDAVEEEEAAEEEDEEEEEVDTSNLGQYSNSELRQLLYQGQITQKQYDDEMKNRQTEDDKRIDRKLF